MIKDLNHLQVYLSKFFRLLFQKLVDVVEFLALPHMKLRSRQVKIHKGPLSIHVKNWNDVKMTLRGTHYERFLNADY